MNFTNQKLTLAKLKVAKKPKSKATALRWYLKDHIGLLHNLATDALRAEFASVLEAVKGRNAPVIIAICRDCGGEDVDGNCRDLIRHCEIANCLLFNVRPYQSKSKVSPEYASPRAFLQSNSSEMVESFTSTNCPLKKHTSEHLTKDCSSMEM